MALHKDLTGAELHEPKGIETATSGQVYVSNGSGSGVWTDRNTDNLLFNKYFLQGQITDISTANDKTFFYVPVKSEILQLSCVLTGPITTSNSILSIYIDGVLFADSLTVPFTSSTAGSSSLLLVSTANTINAGSVIEIRSDGGSDTVTKAIIQLGLRAKS